MFVKTNYFVPAFLSLVFVSIASAQIAPPPGRGVRGLATGLPPPNSIGVAAIPPAPSGQREDGESAVSRKDKKLIEPEAADITKYKTLLDKPGYGIVKLLNSKCSTGPTNVYVVSAAEDCANSLPGNGSSFSFRRREYSAPPVSDIKTRDGKFIVGSSFTQGLIVLLGEVDVEKIDLDASGIKYIVNFQPAVELPGAQRQTSEIKLGITDSSYVYSGSADVKESQAYVLRSIAYRVAGNTRDKRRDIIIAFQVVRQDEDGNVTLIWRELQNKRSPKLAQEK